jgi:flagellar motility protein MotE (MotC chaperone)
MTKKKIILLSILLFILLVAGLGGFFVKKRYEKMLAEKKQFIDKEKAQIEKAANAEIEVKNELLKTQESLTTLAQSLKRNLDAEQKLSLTMISQLQTFEALLSNLKSFSHEVENNIAILNRISDKQFQEDVKLQAALYKGKKAEIVADHLSEFHANRAGAILANMKEQEASDVLDVWAVSNDPKTSEFYREVMAAYLDNKRYLQNPSFYKSLTEREKPIGNTAFRAQEPQQSSTLN